MDRKDELVKGWLHRAEHDLGIARLALEHQPEYTDVICFHCQQAVEKLLKAYLTHRDIPFKRTHSLTYLLDLLDEKEQMSDDLYSMAEELEGYAVEIRYPDDWQEPTQEEGREAYRIAIAIREVVLGKMASDE